MIAGLDRLALPLVTTFPMPTVGASPTSNCITNTCQRPRGPTGREWSIPPTSQTSLILSAPIAEHMETAQKASIFHRSRTTSDEYWRAAGPEQAVVLSAGRLLTGAAPRHRIWRLLTEAGCL